MFSLLLPRQKFPPPMTIPTCTPSWQSTFTCLATSVTVASSNPVFLSPARASPLNFNNTRFIGIYSLSFYIPHYNNFFSVCVVLFVKNCGCSRQILPGTAAAHIFLFFLQGYRHKNIIDCLDRRFKITVLHTDDDVQLAGSLIDHFHIDMGVGQSGKDPAGRTSGPFHTASHHGNQRQIRFQLYGIRINCPMQPGNHALLLFLELVLMDEYRQRIDAGRHVFKTQTVFFEYLQYFSAETDF